MAADFETDRVVLRQFVESDAPLLLALDSDPVVMRYVGPYGLPNEAPYRERIRTYFQPYYSKGPDFGFWVAEEKKSGQFIGWFHLRPAIDYRFAREAGFLAGEFDVGYRLVRTAWNKGFATEVTRALVNRGFARPAVEAIVACVLVPNVASVRVLEKSGLRKVNEFLLPGFDVPAAKYSISRADWLSGDS
jgi:RimJ/RimL family protein N-acetyltransferase